MRIRSIKPEFWSSFTLAKLSEPALILAVGLLNHSCDAGYFEADPRIIKAAIFPLREPSRSITGCLAELAGIEYIEVRKAVDGRIVGRVINFASHQKVNNPSKRPSKAKADYDKGLTASEFSSDQRSNTPSLFESSCSTTVTLHEDSQKNPSGTGSREQGTGSEGAGAESGARAEEPSVARDRNRALPETLNTPAFREAWERWLIHWAQAFHRERPMPDGTAIAQLRELSAMGSERAIAAINNSIAKGTLSKPAEPFSASGRSPAVKPATVWELQQREQAIKQQLREFMDGHKGERYVGMKPGATSPYEWTAEGRAAYAKLKSDLDTVRQQLATVPDGAHSAA
jgi:hypothetical protein